MSECPNTQSHPLTPLGQVALAFILVATGSLANAQDNANAKMEYQIAHLPLLQATALINNAAAQGWRLKSASPSVCPARAGQTGSAPCVFTILERQKP